MRSWFRLDTVAAAAAALLALALFPRPAAADHSLGNSCYVCHKLGSASVYRGTRAIDTSKSIGLAPPVTQPLNCEFCHTDYRSSFNATAKSAHPVKLIEGGALYVHGNGSYQPEGNYGGVKLICKDCHGGDTVGGSPNRSPDVAPVSYDSAGKASSTDGYPDHQLVAAANGSVQQFVPAWDSSPAAGDEPHTVGVYNHKASTAPSTDFALCLSCHNATGQTTREVNVAAAYAAGGHFFKSDGARIACLDCHDTHGSTSIKLYNRSASPITNTNGRALCLECHTGASRTFTSTTAGQTRSVTVPAPPTSGPGAIAAHSGGTTACTYCHDAHNPLGNRSDCYDCHSTNTTSEYKTALGTPPSYTKYVDDGATGGADDFGYSGGFPSKHNISNFTNGDSASCLDCHALTAGQHGNGSTHDDLKYSGPNGVNWPVSSVNESGSTFGSGIEFCLGCHRGGTNYWPNLVPPAMNTFVDFGPDGVSSTTGDNVTNYYGQGDATVTGYSSNTPTIYDTDTGSGHDPPSNYQGVPMFGHYTQGGTSAGTKWWQLGATSAPQPLPCLDCHYAHGAPNEALYRSPRGTTGLRSEKGPNATPREICLNCHNSAASLYGITPDDPTSGPINDRYGNPVGAHNSGSTTVSCSSSATQCHNPHSPSCEVCHSYPP